MAHTLDQEVTFHSLHEFTNNWSFDANLIFHSEQVDTRMLRGGPDMIMPNNIMTFGQVKTDQSKKFILDFAYEYVKSGDGSATNYTFGPGFQFVRFNILN